MPSSSFDRFVRPPTLARGDVVSLVAPAGRYAEAAREQGCAWLRAQGLGIEPMQPASPHFAFAGTTEARAAEWRDALAAASPCVWAVRGGSGTGRIVPHVEPALGASLRAAPRWLVGFSDITALHARAQAAGLMSLHAANVTTLPSWSEAARQELWDCLTRPGMSQRFEGEPIASGGTTLRQAQGPLVGGNLTVLASLVGCQVLPSWRGAIVLFEDIDERPYRLARALGQLIDGNALEGIAGVAFGQMTRCEDPAAGYSTQALLLDTLAPLQVPVVWGLPIGHDDASRPVVLGAQAHLDAQAGTLEVVS